jgi:hypothetical protein
MTLGPRSSMYNWSSLYSSMKRDHDFFLVLIWVQNKERRDEEIVLAYIYIYIYTHTCTHTHIYTYTYIYLQVIQCIYL